MQILFKNNYTRNKEWAKDSSRYIFFQRPGMIVLQAYIAFSLIFAIWNLVIDYSFLQNGISLLFIIVFVELLILFRYKQNVKLILKRDIEMYGKTVDVVTTVTDELITVENSAGMQIHLHYSDIKKVVKTKKYIYLRSTANVFYSFKKDGFSVGTANDFLNFLKTKGIR